VLASGNLGLISFTQWTERMTMEQIQEAFPGLISGLVRHPGLGFVMVRSEKRGPLAIGPDGVYVLDDDTVEGKNPIEIYGPLTPYHLRRHDSFDNCPDILVISTYWPETGEVAALEELIGNHGGLGGWQRHPYIMHPASLDAGEELILGPGALNAVMRGWIDAVQPRRKAIMEARRADIARENVRQSVNTESMPVDR
jgi:putative membrane protein